MLVVDCKSTNVSYLLSDGHISSQLCLRAYNLIYICNQDFHSAPLTISYNLSIISLLLTHDGIPSNFSLIYSVHMLLILPSFHVKHNLIYLRSIKLAIGINRIDKPYAKRGSKSNII